MTPPGCPGGGDNVPVTAPRYAERQPQAAPVRPVVCVWTWQNTGRNRLGQLIVPDGCVDLVWREGRLEVVGPDRGPRTVTAPGGSAIAGIRLRPGAAGLLLGRVPTPELLDTQVPLEEFDAGGARRLADGLAHADGPWAAARLLDHDARHAQLQRTGFDRGAHGDVQLLQQSRIGPGLAARRDAVRRLRVAVGLRGDRQVAAQRIAR